MSAITQHAAMHRYKGLYLLKRQIFHVLLETKFKISSNKMFAKGNLH